MDVSWTATELGMVRRGAGMAPARRAGQSVLVALVILFAFVAMSQPAAAAAPAPPFTQCEPVGQDHTCGSLLVVNPDRSVSVYSDSSVGPYEGSDDTLVGIENQSAQPVAAIVVYGQTPLFGFDGDGLCTQSPRPAKCRFGPTEYEGPETSFVLDPTTQNDGEVDFAGSGIPPGGHRYFSLESAVTSATLKVLVGRLSSCPEAGQMYTPFSRDEYQGTRADGHVGIATWNLEYGISKCEGLVLANVSLGNQRITRSMAERMSLPYLDLETCTGPGNSYPNSVADCAAPNHRHIVLRPDEVEPQTDPSLYTNVHLLTTKVVPYNVPAPTGGPCYSSPICNHRVLEATYRVDLAPPTGNPTNDQYLDVTQRYEFYVDFDEGHYWRLACEPAHGAPVPGGSPLALEDCGRWKPLVKYVYHRGISPEILDSFNAAERLHFTPDAVAIRGESFFRDCDSIYPLIGCLFGSPTLGTGLFEDEELHNETVARAITQSDTPPFNSQPGRFDNLHLTGSDKAGAPFPPPGCAPCVHMHWRWGFDVAKKAEDLGAHVFGRGLPLTADGEPAASYNPKSKETLDVGVVTYHSDELSPRNFMELVRGANPDSLNMQIIHNSSNQLEYQGGITTGTDTLNYGPAGCYATYAIESWGQCGAVVWLSATTYGENVDSAGNGEEDQDTLFASGGFWCATCKLEPDYSEFLTLKPKYSPPTRNAKAGHPITIAYGRLNGQPFGTIQTFIKGGDIKIFDLLPSGMSTPVVKTIDPGYSPINCSRSQQTGRWEVACDMSNGGGEPWPCVRETCVTIEGTLPAPPGEYDNVSHIVWQELGGEHIAGNIKTVEPIMISP